MTTELLNQNLSRIGLSDREQAVYLALLQLGVASVLEIAKKAQVERTGIYSVLQSLIEAGLVSETTVGKKRAFVAENPSQLVNYVKEKEALAGEILPELQSLWNATDTKPKIRYFEGVNGMKTVLEDVLTSSDKQLYGILSAADLFGAVGERWFEDYTKRRIKAGLSLKVVRSQAKEVGERWPTDPAANRELRYTPEGMVFSMTTYIYTNKVALLSTRQENFGMIIESDEYATTQRHLFNALWEISKPMSKQ